MWSPTLTFRGVAADTGLLKFSRVTRIRNEFLRGFDAPRYALCPLFVLSGKQLLKDVVFPSSASTTTARAVSMAYPKIQQMPDASVARWQVNNGQTNSYSTVIVALR